MAVVYVGDYGSGSTLLCQACFDSLDEDDKLGFEMMDTNDPVFDSIKSEDGGHLFCEGEDLKDGVWVSCRNEIR